MKHKRRRKGLRSYLIYEEGRKYIKESCKMSVQESRILSFFASLTKSVKLYATFIKIFLKLLLYYFII